MKPGLFLSTYFSLFIAFLSNAFLINGILVYYEEPKNLSWRSRILERYLEFESMSLLGCARECRRRRRCESFNYSRAMNFCELCYVTLADGSLDPNAASRIIFIHSDIKSWKLELGKCKNLNTSPINSKCNINTGEYEVSDCGPAPTFAKALLFTHGHHEVGNGITYRCHDNHDMLDDSGNKINSGEITVLCTKYGQWNSTSFTCEEAQPSTTTTTTEKAVTTTENETSATTTDAVVSTTESYCLSPWKYFNGHCYFFISQQKSWTEAKDECIGMGAHLIKIDNKEENSWIHSEISRPWLGGNDRTKESHWIWETDYSVVPTTTDMSQYSNWANNEPNDAGKREDCMEMYKNGKWNDINCNAKRSAACEKAES